MACIEHKCLGQSFELDVTEDDGDLIISSVYLVTDKGRPIWLDALNPAYRAFAEMVKEDATEDDDFYTKCQEAFGVSWGRDSDGAPVLRRAA